MTDQIADIVKGLSERHRMILTGIWWNDEGLNWREIVDMARKPGDKLSMTYAKMVKPLIKRGLLEEISPSAYIYETDTFIQALFALTNAGHAVRNYLQEQNNGPD